MAKMDIRAFGAPIKHSGTQCHFFNRAFQMPFDCQAIFTILPANSFGLRV
jgi:hypothetical protein